MKTDLLQIYTNDVDEPSAESKLLVATCARRQPIKYSFLFTDTPTGIRHIALDLLQNKVKKLETENVSLRQEASQLATDTFECEEKEKDLVTDVIKQLSKE